MSLHTVRVFQDAVVRLADSPNDPVVETMDQLAEEVAALAEENARVIIPNLPDGVIDVETGKDTKGLFFRIRIDSTQGKFSRYLAAKALREHNILEPAVREVVGAGNLRTASGRALRRFNRSF